MASLCRSAEGEGVDPDARVQEGDLERAVVDRVGLADELVQPRSGGRAVSPVVHVDPASGTWWSSVEADPKSDGVPAGDRRHDEVHVAGVEAVGDPAPARFRIVAWRRTVQSPERAQWSNRRRAGNA